MRQFDSGLSLQEFKKAPRGFFSAHVQLFIMMIKPCIPNKQKTMRNIFLKRLSFLVLALSIHSLAVANTPTTQDEVFIATKLKAESGDVAAQGNLGTLYATGSGTEQDYVKAREWYEKAAAQGYTSAQNDLGTVYASGEGVTRDYIKAREWFEKAAAQGYAPAQNDLGTLYASGHGVPRDYAKARELFEKAAAQGHAIAQENLGKLPSSGEDGAPKD